MGDAPPSASRHGPPLSRVRPSSTVPSGGALPAIARGEGALLWDTERPALHRRLGRRRGGERRPRPDARSPPPWRARPRAAAYVHGTQFTSEVLEEYARRLAPHVPIDGPRLYLVSGGSEANETAVKMARAYQLAVGQASRHKVIRALDLVPRQHPGHPLALGPAEPPGPLPADAPRRHPRRPRPSATTARSGRPTPTAASPARTSSRP